MGRLRDRRRGGGASRTITGLTRTGTANKLLGSKGGIQYPIVGEVEAGETLAVVHTTGKRITTTTLASRRTGVLLAGVDWHNGGPYPDPETTDATYGVIGYAKKGDNVLTWTDGNDCTFTFWVF